MNPLSATGLKEESALNNEFGVASSVVSKRDDLETSQNTQAH
jgi:hypothetical protein